MQASIRVFFFAANTNIYWPPEEFNGMLICNRHSYGREREREAIAAGVFELWQKICYILARCYSWSKIVIFCLHLQATAAEPHWVVNTVETNKGTNMSKMWPMRRVIKYSLIAGSTVCMGLSLHTNDYDINSLGVVRFSRAALTVAAIGFTYNQNLYKKQWDRKSHAYKVEKSRTHAIAAEKLLQLICTNKGVYIKVGQHIGSLDYLLPPEYVSTMKMLHSNAPKNPVEDIYKVIRQDLKINVSQWKFCD